MLIYVSFYLRAADIFFAVICIILSFDYKFLVSKFHVNNVICRVTDIIIIIIIIIISVFPLFINSLHVIYLSPLSVDYIQNFVPPVNVVVFFFITNAYLTFRYDYSTSQLLITNS